MPLSQIHIPDTQEIATKVAYGFWTTVGVASVWWLGSQIKRFKICTVKAMQNYVDCQLNKFQKEILKKIEEKLAENTISCAALQENIDSVKEEIKNVSARVDILIGHLIK